MSFVVLSALLLSACTTLPPIGEGHGQSESVMALPTPSAGEISVVAARARPSPTAAGNGAAYLALLNGRDQDVQLVAVASSAAATVELHETIDDNGVMRMQPRPEGFTVPAGGSVQLEPGGKHIMLIDLVTPLEIGATIAITLTFDSGDVIAQSVPVVDLDAMPMDMEGSATPMP